MSTKHRVRLFKNGSNQSVRIRTGSPAPSKSLPDVLATLKPIDEALPPTATCRRSRSSSDALPARFNIVFASSAARKAPFLHQLLDAKRPGTFRYFFKYQLTRAAPGLV